MSWDPELLHAEVLREFAFIEDGFYSRMEERFFLFERSRRRHWNQTYEWRHPERVKMFHRRRYQRIRNDPVAWSKYMERQRKNRKRAKDASRQGGHLKESRCQICHKKHYRSSKWCSDKCSTAAYYRRNKDRWRKRYNHPKTQKACPECGGLGHYRKTCPSILRGMENV